MKKRKMKTKQHISNNMTIPILRRTRRNRRARRIIRIRRRTKTIII